MNRALRESRGDVFLFLGPDTVLGPGAVETLWEHLRRHPEAGAAAPRLVDSSDRPQPSCRRFPTLRDVLFELTALPRLFPGRFRPAWKIQETGGSSVRDVEQPEATCFLLRRQTIDTVGFLDERFPIFFNDVDYCRRIREAGMKIAFVPGAVVRHVRGASVRQHRAAMIWKSHQGFYRYFRKYAAPGWKGPWVHALGCLLIAAAFTRTVLRACFPECGKPW
jgi:hypothetical protein